MGDDSEGIARIADEHVQRVNSLNPPGECSSNASTISRYFIQSFLVEAVWWTILTDDDLRVLTRRRSRELKSEQTVRGAFEEPTLSSNDTLPEAGMAS